MKKRMFWILLCCLVQAAAGSPAADLRITQTHPRLLLPAGGEEALRTKIAKNDLVRRAHEAILARSAEVLAEPLPEKIVTGRRMLSVSRRVLEQVYFLSYSYRMTGDRRFATKAGEIMLAAAAFPDWNPSHFLDVGEMTAALSIGYDWLHAELPEETRVAIRRAIWEKGLNESLPERATNPKNPNWLEKNNNWNAVCNTGMAFGAVAAYEDDPRTAESIIDRAIRRVRDGALHEYLPDGNYPEGYTYWRYGTSFAIMLIDALENLYGTSFGMTDNPGFMRSPRYMLHMGTQGMGCFGYSDCGSQKPGISHAAFWFARRTDNPSLLWQEMQRIGYMDRTGLTPHIFAERFLPSFILWAPEDMSGMQPPAERTFVGQGVTPVALLRNHWGGDDEIFLGLKGGRGLTNHAHMDMGSFFMQRGGNQWATDLGMQEYHSLEAKGLSLTREQGSPRWTVFRNGMKGHNLIIFADAMQRVDVRVTIDGHGDRPGFVHAWSDLTAVNGGVVAAYRRGVAIADDRYVVVRDEIENVGRDTPIRWAMVTPAAVRIVDGRTAELSLNGEKLYLKVDGEGVTMNTWSTAPQNDYDAPNPGTVMVGFTATLAPGEKTTYNVYLVPEAAYASFTPNIRPIARWGAPKPE